MARNLDASGLDATPEWVPQGSMMRAVLGLPPANEQRICPEVETFVEQSVAMVCDTHLLSDVLGLAFAASSYVLAFLHFGSAAIKLRKRKDARLS